MPKPYSFKLEKILDFRKQVEEQARLALAEATRLHADQKKIVDEIEQKRINHQKKEYEKLSVDDLWLWRQYNEALTKDLHSAQNRLTQLALNLQRCRTEAVQKSKDRKLLEKLKENQAKKYYEEENLKEQKEYDEMATLRFKSKTL